jgi:hypothetical protein
LVDQLLTASTPRQAADAASNLRRLEALLSPGQPRTAQVVQVSPQPLPAATTNTQQGTASAPQNTAAGNVATAPTPTGTTPAATNPVLTNPPPPSPSTGTAQPAAPSANELYRIQIRLQGRLFELLTNKPLEPGSQVQLSRGNSQQILLQPLPVSTGADGKPASTPAQAQAQAAGQAGPQSQSATQPGQPAAPLASAAAGPANLTARAAVATAPIATEPSQPASRRPAAPATTTSSAPATPASTTPAAPPATGNSVASQAPAAAPGGAVKTTAESATERVQLQPLNQLPIIRPGQSLKAEVVSAKPLPASASPVPATSPQGGTKTAAPTAASTTGTAANPRAEAVTASQVNVQNFKIRINLQGQRIDLISPRPIQAGSQIQLSLTPQGQIQAELPSAKTQAIEQALREHLPQQQPPSALLNLISAAQASGQLQQAKPVLLNLIQLLTGRTLSNPQQTDADNVRQQVNNSGSLFESKLARGDTQSLNLDHKALLLKLSQQLGQAGGQRELPQSLSERLMQMTQQALSRVLVNQITSLGGQPQEGAVETNRALVLDIPILWQDKTENLQLKIQREAQEGDYDGDEQRYRWQVRLHFEIEEARVLQADLTLEGEQISVIWSGDNQLRRRVQSRLDTLQQQLEEIGLEVNVLGVREQAAEINDSPRPPRNQLIDIQT